MQLEFKTVYTQLNKQQQAAVDAIDGPVLVIAGPGTGKTQLLSVRVANILNKTDTLPANVLCLTFTESAQINMQDRLTRLIGPIASKVAIHTFHSFGNHIIGTNGDYFQEAFGFKASDDITRYEILAEILEKLPRDVKLAQQFDGDFFYLKDIQQRISQLKQAGIAPEDFAAKVDDDRKWCEEATKKVAEHLQGMSRISAKMLPNFNELYNSLLAVSKQDQAIQKSLAQSCCEELAIAITATEGKQTQPLTAWKSRWLVKTGSGDFSLKATRQLQKLIELVHVYKAYQAALQKLRLYDYDDMIMRLIDTLKKSNDLRAELQEQYQYILVDEYQDTNGAQQQLLELLADNPVNEDKPNIMVVGDDDQAIYGFQGATQSNMLDFITRWPNCLKIVLGTNYRSSTEIVAFCRQLILLGEDRLEMRYPDMSKQLTANSTTITTKPMLSVLPSRAEQYIWLAQEIKHHITEGIDPLQIAVIAPRHKYLEALVPFLENESINVAYERRQDVLAQPHIMQIVLLTRVITHIAAGEIALANVYIAELLSAEWWEIQPGWLWEISLEANKKHCSWFEVMEHSERPAMIAIFGWLIAMAKESLTTPLEIMLDHLIGPEVLATDTFVSPYRAYYFNPERMSESVTYLKLLSGLISLRRAIRKYQPNKALVLKDFVSFVDLHSQAGLSLSDDHPIVLDTSAVQLLTAHKAKGLEFENVFILNSDEQTWRGERSRHNNISLPANLEYIAPASDTVDEKLRLMYVAVTRAKKRLMLLTQTTSDDGKQTLPLGWLQAETVRVLLDDAAITSSQPTANHRQLTAAIQNDWLTPHFNLRTEAPWKALLQDNLQRYQLSPTHLTAFLDVSRGGPKSFLINQLLHFPQALSVNAQFGNVMHTMLERLHAALNTHTALPSMSVAETWLDEIIENYHFGLIEEPKAKRRGRISLQLVYEQYAHTLTVGQLAEYDFAGEGAMIERARIKGRIDAMQLNKQQHTATVVDYKTGSSIEKWLPPNVNTFSAHKAHRYRQQLGFYQLLIEHSRSFQGYHVTQGSLVFLEPNEDGQLTELSLMFDSEEKVLLSKLITKVFTHITALDLPDTSHYSADLQGTRDFENDLLADLI
jgi:DNA helicase-2/ATP-dependent DNA helicase PcrA